MSEFREFLPHEKEHRAYSFCGTIEYMAPEAVRGNNHGHDIAVDWWSVGVLTYELLTGASPFTVEGEKNTQQEISKRILKSEAPMPGFLSDDVKDFILKLLVKEPRKRLGGGTTDAINPAYPHISRTPSRTPPVAPIGAACTDLPIPGPLECGMRL